MEFVGGPASLRAQGGGPSGLLLGVLQQFAVVEAGARVWRVEPRTYEFRLLDHLERELLVYHWQPGPELRGPDHPHLHVSAALRAQTNAVTTQVYDLDRRHLPTGYVSLAMMVRMVIQEFGVAPLRQDWQQVVDRTEVLTERP
ncbi:MAG: hypothetical protein KC442_00695 [Thermomicrobiales bacterium]|nr:hypothetical protein [Thermomicrobiales bacterium]